MFNQFPTINPGQAWDILVNSVVRSLRLGKLNCLGEVTLATGSSTTTLNDDLIGLDSLIILMPLTANAKAEGIPYQTGHVKGQVTLNHVNSGTAGRAYRYAVIG